MKPLGQADRRIANIHTSEFRPYVFPDGEALGDAVLQLDDTRPLADGFHVYRMPPGMTSRPHRHNGAEHFLILEGSLIDHDGTRFRVGDLVFYADGSEHSSYTPDGCLLAVFITGAETSL